VTRVVIPDHLASHTGGVRELELTVADFRELLAVLDERFPGAAAAFRRCAVAIDGQIYQDAFLEPLDAASEVFFMQRIEGG
jgi:hypothetical protein